MRDFLLDFILLFVPQYKDHKEDIKNHHIAIFYFVIIALGAFFWVGNGWLF